MLYVRHWRGAQHGWSDTVDTSCTGVASAAEVRTNGAGTDVSISTQQPQHARHAQTSTGVQPSAFHSPLFCPAIIRHSNLTTWQHMQLASMKGAQQCIHLKLVWSVLYTQYLCLLRLVCKSHYIIPLLACTFSFLHLYFHATFTIFISLYTYQEKLNISTMWHADKIRTTESITMWKPG